jgi:hypothetical protein
MSAHCLGFSFRVQRSTRWRGRCCRTGRDAETSACPSSLPEVPTLSPPATQIHYSAREPNLSHLNDCSCRVRVACVFPTCRQARGHQVDRRGLGAAVCRSPGASRTRHARRSTVRPPHALVTHDNLLRTRDTRHDTTRHDTTRHNTTRHDTTRHDTTRQHLTAPLRVGCRTNCRREVQHIAFSPVHPWLMFTGHASGSILVWSISAPKQGAQSRCVLLFFTYI